MNCQEVLEKLSAHMDNELNSIQNKTITQHLGQCPGCRKEFAAFQHADQMIQALPRMELPPAVIGQIDPAVCRTFLPVKKSFLNSWVFVPINGFCENLFELLNPLREKESRPMEEFNDFPPASFGYIYFKIMNPGHTRF